jgi:hypothetical protein
MQDSGDPEFFEKYGELKDLKSALLFWSFSSFWGESTSKGICMIFPE